jgi:sugar phosphate isomerase/epimerase
MGRYGYDLRLRLCYHNHRFEFANGGAEINALMREADTDNVHFIIDTGDAIREKADLAALFTKYHKRIDGLHVATNPEFQYEPLAIAVKKLKWTGWVIAEEERDSAIPGARDQIRKLFGT